MAIQFKGSSIGGVIPDFGELQERELGINTADGKLFTNNGSDIIEIGADNINTGLEKFSNGGIGWRLILENQSAVIGTDAIDLSPNRFSGQVGAQANNSVTLGVDNLVDATGTNSTSIGNSNVVYAPDSVGIGVSNNIGFAIGVTDSIAIGKNNSSTKSFNIIVGSGNSSVGEDSIIIGRNNEQNDTGGISNILIGEGLLGGTDNICLGRFNVGTSTNQFELGNGSNSTAKANFFEINSSGVAIATQATNVGDITSAGNQALVTVGFLGDASTGGVISVNGFSGAVVITTDNIAEANDKLYITASNTSQIGINTSDILNLDTTKQDIITGTAGQLYSYDGVSQVLIDNTFVGSLDTPINYGSAVAGQVVMVNVTQDGVEFKTLDSTDSGLPNVLNMDSLMLITDVNETRGDGTVGTANQLKTTLDGLQANKIQGVTPQIDDVGSILKVLTADGTPDGYSTEWAGNVYSFLQDVGDLRTDNTNANKFLRTVPDLITAITDSTPIMQYVDIAQADVTGLVADLSVITSDVSNVTITANNNTTDIATNTTNIGTNTTDIATNTTNIGTLSNLTTTAQTDLVVAINEVNASAGGDIVNYRTESIDFTVAHLDYVFTDSTAGVINVTLPIGVANNVFKILDVNSSFGTLNNVTLTPDGVETIMGVNAPFTLDVDNREYKVIYTGNDWRVI